MIIGDSAYPPANYPGPPVEGWGFYIGGNTPHVWADKEIAQLKSLYRYLLPIFTRSQPQGPGQGTTDGKAAVSRAMAIGQPHGTAIMLDLETAVNPGYTQAFERECEQGGYVLIDYGSATTVTNNPRPAGGYDLASWTADGTDPGPTDTGLQYTDTGPYDLNDFRADTPLWDLQPAEPHSTSKDDDMSTTADVNGRAGLSWPAGTRHAVQVTCDPAVNADKPFNLRGVLALTTGPVVFSMDVTSGTAVYEIPAEHVATCRGVILEQGPAGGYDAVAV